MLASLALRAGSDIGAMRYSTPGFLVSKQQGGIAHAPDSFRTANQNIPARGKYDLLVLIQRERFRYSQSRQRPPDCSLRAYRSSLMLFAGLAAREEIWLSTSMEDSDSAPPMKSWLSRDWALKGKRGWSALLLRRSSEWSADLFLACASGLALADE
jgi:hypothetical protein